MLIGNVTLHLPLCEGCDDWDTAPMRVDDKLVGDLQRAKDEGYPGVWKECSYSCYRAGKTIRSPVAIWKRHGKIRAIQGRASPFRRDELLDLTE